MSKKIAVYELGLELERLLGIERIVDASIHFPLGGLVRADVSFYVNEIQAKAILKLCKDGKWRDAQKADEMEDMA